MSSGIADQSPATNDQDTSPMAANLAAVRTLVRRDLHDEDSAAYRWTDTVIDRHITRAVNEYSLHAPLEDKDTLTTTAGSRDISIASLSGLIEIAAVEWPTGEFPPRLVGFSKWVTTITLDSVNPPAGVENVAVYWYKAHTLDGSGSSIPAIHDDVIAAGAAAYAALDWTSYAINRINTGGDDTQERYARFGRERLAYFEGELRRIGIRSGVRQRRMYTTDAPSIFEQQRVKY
jgi:hypothetical protein